MAQKIQSVFSIFVLFILDSKKIIKERNDYELAWWGIARAGSFKDANEQLHIFLNKHENILATEGTREYTYKSKEVKDLCTLIYKKWPSEALNHLNIPVFIYRK